METSGNEGIEINKKTEAKGSQTEADRKWRFLQDLSHQGGILNGLKSMEEPGEEEDEDEHEYYWDKVINRLERWVEEQPQKMSELHFIVNKIKPDIMLFLDTSGRPAGLLYKNFRDLLETSPNAQKPQIEFAAPGTRMEDVDPRYSSVGGAEKMADAVKQREFILEALRKRFADKHYQGKTIMVVDEASQTGKQLAFVKSAIEGEDKRVIGVSLGHDDSGFNPELAENADYVLGSAMIPPWSRHIGAIDSEVTGVRKASIKDFQRHAEEHPEKVSQTTYPLNNYHEGDDRSVLRDALKQLAQSCVQYYQEFTPLSDLDAEPLRRGIASIDARVEPLKRLVEEERKEKEKLKTDQEYTDLRNQLQELKKNPQTNARQISQVEATIHLKERILNRIGTEKKFGKVSPNSFEGIRANERVHSATQMVEKIWLPLHLSGMLHELMPALSIMETGSTDSKPSWLVESLITLAKKELRNGQTEMNNQFSRNTYLYG